MNFVCKTVMSICVMRKTITVDILALNCICKCIGAYTYELEREHIVTKE